MVKPRVVFIDASVADRASLVSAADSQGLHVNDYLEEGVHICVSIGTRQHGPLVPTGGTSRRTKLLLTNATQGPRQQSTIEDIAKRIGAQLMTGKQFLQYTASHSQRGTAAKPFLSSSESGTCVFDAPLLKRSSSLLSCGVSLLTDSRASSVAYRTKEGAAGAVSGDEKKTMGIARGGRGGGGSLVRTKSLSAASSASSSSSMPLSLASRDRFKPLAAGDVVRLSVTDLDGLFEPRNRTFAPAKLDACRVHRDAPPSISFFLPREQWPATVAARGESSGRAAAAAAAAAAVACASAPDASEGDGDMGANEGVDGHLHVRPPSPVRQRQKGASVVKMPGLGFCECCCVSFSGTADQHCQSSQQHREFIANDANYVAFDAILQRLKPGGDPSSHGGTVEPSLTPAPVLTSSFPCPTTRPPPPTVGSSDHPNAANAKTHAEGATEQQAETNTARKNSPRKRSKAAAVVAEGLIGDAGSSVVSSCSLRVWQPPGSNSLSARPRAALVGIGAKRPPSQRQRGPSSRTPFEMPGKATPSSTPSTLSSLLSVSSASSSASSSSSSSSSALLGSTGYDGGGDGGQRGGRSGDGQVPTDDYDGGGGDGGETRGGHVGRRVRREGASGRFLCGRVAHRRTKFAKNSFQSGSNSSKEYSDGAYAVGAGMAVATTRSQYTVAYDDGDEEEMSSEELEPFLVNLEALNPPSRHHRGRPSSSNAVVFVSAKSLLHQGRTAESSSSAPVAAASDEEGGGKVVDSEPRGAVHSPSLKLSASKAKHGEKEGPAATDSEKKGGRPKRTSGGGRRRSVVLTEPTSAEDRILVKNEIQHKEKK